MALPAFLLNIDFYGISVALPAIGEALGAGTTGLQWAVNGFNLALIAPLIAFGRLGDLVGRRRLLLVGVVLFALGSAMCGFASDMGTLIAGRCVQGLAVALFSTSPLSIVGEVFPEDRHALAFSIWAAIGAAGSAVGPLVGGALTDLFGWRWFFFINLPVAALTIVLVLAIVPELKDETARGAFDRLGFVAITLGLAALVYGLQAGDDAGWTALPVLGSLSPARPMLLAAVKAERTAEQPLLEPGLFRPAGLPCHPGSGGGRELRLQRGDLFLGALPAGPASAGARCRPASAMLAFSICFVVTLPLAGSLMRRAGPRALMAVGMALMAGASLLFLPGGLWWLVAGPGRGRDRPGLRIQHVDHRRHGRRARPRTPVLQQGS